VDNSNKALFLLKEKAKEKEGKEEQKQKKKLKLKTFFNLRNMPEDDSSDAEMEKEGTPVKDTEVSKRTRSKIKS